MTMNEWNTLLNWITEAWEHLTNIIRQVADALTEMFGSISIDNLEKKYAEEKRLFMLHCKKNHYLKSRAPIYKAERKNTKHSPYQRRNY